MNEAVIVSTARTPLCKSWRGSLNLTHGAKMGGHVVHAALERAKVDADEVEDVIIGCANPEGATGWNIARQVAIRAGCPVTRAGHDGEPLLLFRPADHRARRAAHHGRRRRDLRRRRRRVDLAGAERDEQAPLPGRVAAPPPSRDLLADAADRRVRGAPLRDLAREAGRVRRAEPAARGQGPRRRQVQGRDRADHHQDEGGGQAHRARDHEGSHRRRRRRYPRRHHLRRRVADQAGDRGRLHRRRQRQPVLRRRFRLRGDVRERRLRAAT